MSADYKSCRARFKNPGGDDEYYDAEVMDDDGERWARDVNGDLDWAYTGRTLGQLTPDALVEFLVNNAFTVPPRDYNPSAPFVHVKFAPNQTGADQEDAAVTTVSLPHGYRLPLMFVAKYMWARALRALPSERDWLETRAHVLHLSRLCENLFRRAHAKALQGGMEKGWRCIMFDRLLARFYKHWDRSNPKAIIGFAQTHGVREYDRDVLKHDWKRWCLRGLHGVKMTENEVTEGITLEQYLGSLRRNFITGQWELNGAPLAHITTYPDVDYFTESSLSSLPSEEEEESSDDGEPHKSASPPKALPQRQEEEEEEDDVVMLATGNVSNRSGSGSKRLRGIPAVDRDELERQQKRSRIERFDASLNNSAANPAASGSTNGSQNNMPIQVATPSTARQGNRGTTPNQGTSSASASHSNPNLSNPPPANNLNRPPNVHHVPHNLPAIVPFYDVDTLLAMVSSREPPPPAAGTRSAAAKSRAGSSSTTPANTNTNMPSGTSANANSNSSGLGGASAAGSVRAPATATEGTGTRSVRQQHQQQQQQQQQPVPAWMVLDSMVKPRGGSARAANANAAASGSGSSARKATGAADKGKGKEKSKSRSKAQKEKEPPKDKDNGKGKEKEKPKDTSQMVDKNAEWSRDAAKMWPNKPTFGPYGNLLHGGLHRPAVSSSAILAAAGTAPQPMHSLSRPPRLATTAIRSASHSGHTNGLSTGPRVVELHDTDSEVEMEPQMEAQMDEEMVSEHGGAQQSSVPSHVLGARPKPHHVDTQGSVSAPPKRRRTMDDGGDVEDDSREIPAHLVQAKALELLVSLVTDSRTGTSGNPALAASVAALAATAKANSGGSPDTTTTLAPVAEQSTSHTVATSPEAAWESIPAYKPSEVASLSPNTVLAAFNNIKKPIPGRLNPVAAAAVSEFSNQCTEQCGSGNTEFGRRYPHPHQGPYPIGFRETPHIPTTYPLLPPAYLRYEQEMRDQLLEKAEAVARGDGKGGVPGKMYGYVSDYAGMDVDEDEGMSVEKDTVEGKGKEKEKEVDQKVALRFEDFEERFAEVKAELVTIVERLVVLENKDVERAARELLEGKTPSGTVSTAPVVETEAVPEVSAQEGGTGKEKESEKALEKEQPQSIEQAPSGGTKDVVVDGGVPNEVPLPPGDMDVDPPVDLSAAIDSSQATEPGASSIVPTEDASSSSTLVEKSKSSTPPPNPHISSEESIASSSANTPARDLQGVDHHSISEVDGSELTTVNVLGKDDVSSDGRSPVLSPALTILVEQLVHAKMLSIMEEMKSKDVHMATEESPKAVGDQPVPPSPSSSSAQMEPQEPTPDVATMFAELRSLKAEFNERQQKDKEEKLAMRELHSAEVDALRRRLSYLENRDPGPMAMPMHMSHRYYPPSYMPGDRGSPPAEHHSYSHPHPHPYHPSHSHSHNGMPAPQGAEPFDAERTRRRGYFPNGGYNRDAPYPESDVVGASSASQHRRQNDKDRSGVSATPTPTPSEKGKSAQPRPSVESVPLPIKSQRKFKHDMSFPKAKVT